MTSRGKHDDQSMEFENECKSSPFSIILVMNGVEYHPRLRWTREKPTVPGDHHLRGGKWASVKPIIVSLEWLAENLVVSFGNTILGRLDRYEGGEWAGPIPLPADPDEEMK